MAKSAKRRLRGVVVRQGFGYTYGLPKRHNVVDRTSNELILSKGYNSLS